MATKPLSRRRQGNDAEQQACRWLQAQGLNLVANNWSSRHGELDLVMLDGQTLVFIEVRLRNQHHFGGAAASVTRSKQKRLLEAASLFLSDQSSWAEHPCRFDVLAMARQNQCYTFTWIKNAFYGD